MLKQLVRDGDVTGFAKIPRRVSAKSAAQSRGVRRLGDPGHKPARCVAPDCNQLRATIFVTMAFPGNIPMTRQALSLHAAPTFGHGVDVGATTTARATTIGGPASLRSTREKVSYRVLTRVGALEHFKSSSDFVLADGAGGCGAGGPLEVLATQLTCDRLRATLRYDTEFPAPGIEAIV
jgi:hypothetical protein